MFYTPQQQKKNNESDELNLIISTELAENILRPFCFSHTQKKDNSKITIFLDEP